MQENFKKQLIFLLQEANEPWLKQRYDSFKDESKFWMNKAHVRLYERAIKLINSIESSSEINEELFFFNVMELVEKDSKEWGTGENWHDYQHSEAVRAVKGTISRCIPEKYKNRYKRIACGRKLSQVFLSYSSYDKSIVAMVGEHLDNIGIKIWLDEININVGDDIQAKIAEAIKESSHFLIFLSSNSVISRWVQVELRQAISKNILNACKIIPVLIEDCEIPGYLIGVKYADLREKSNINFLVSQLIKSIDEGIK